MEKEKKTIIAGGTVTTTTDDEYTYIGGTVRTDEYVKMIGKMVEGIPEHINPTFNPLETIGASGKALYFEEAICNDYDRLWAHPDQRDKGTKIYEQLASKHNYNPTGVWRILKNHGKLKHERKK